MIKKRLFFTATVCFISLISASSYADTVAVPVTATVQAGTLSLTKAADMNFGTVVSGTALSTITINASAGAATPTLTSGNASVSGGGSGRVTVGTNIDASVTVTYALVGSNATAEKIENGAVSSMTLTNSSITANSTPSPLAITVAGPNTIHVGGVLQVGASQVAANYTGTCTVTVNY